MKTSYSKVARFWDLGMAISGWNSGLNRYINRLPIRLPDNPTILDIGCGPGILSFSLLKKYPNAKIIATDIDEIMVQEAERIACKNKIDKNNLLVAKSDINCPNKIILKNGEIMHIEPDYFDLIVAGGVLEHADTSIAMPALKSMLKPNGFLLIIGMNEKSLIGKIYEVLYKFCLLPREYMLNELTLLGYRQVSLCPLDIKDFPANLSRSGFIAQK